MIKVQHRSGFDFRLISLTSLVLSNPRVIGHLPTLFCMGKVYLPEGVRLSLVKLDSQRFYSALAASREFQLQESRDYLNQ
jgi:hypothetical protein